MVERITPRQFHAAPGVEDWRVLYEGARTYFVTGSFAKGVEFVRRIGELADAANHHPNVDLRYGGVAVTINTHEIGGDISERDASLAAQISAAARELGIRADPSRVQTVQIAIDALVIPEVLPFWKAVLGYNQLGGEDVVDPLGRGPNLWFQQAAPDGPRGARGRVHVDVSVPRDQAEARIAAALAAGGRVVTDRFAPKWWTLADSEGNVADLAPWRDDED
ncbi:MAG TPA: 4a-hydroxytetrahydrobiopterin dehydratase [Trebonia sp.]|jgi:4a-hydroxytetrahydrobiopterin dehydratase|nr:4a-hydroxytetrahydrobiopterin dehydratase [Trebonia sp.]